MSNWVDDWFYLTHHVCGQICREAAQKIRFLELNNQILGFSPIFIAIFINHQYLCLRLDGRWHKKSVIPNTFINTSPLIRNMILVFFRYTENNFRVSGILKMIFAFQVYRKWFSVSGIPKMLFAFQGIPKMIFAFQGIPKILFAFHGIPKIFFAFQIRTIKTKLCPS